MLAVVPIAGCTPPAEEAPTRGRLLVLACESQAGIVRAEAALFHSVYADAHVSVLPVSTRDAIVQLLNDSVRCVCVDRPLNAEERTVAEKAGIQPTEIKIAIDALAAVTHPSNPVPSYDLATLRGMLDGSIASWSRVPGATAAAGPVRLVLPGPNSGTYELLARTFFHLPAGIRPAAVVDSLADAVRYVAAHPGAFSLVPVALTRDSALPAVHIAKIRTTDSTGTTEDVLLHQANVYLGKYPLSYPLYLYFTGTGSSLAAGFTSFVASAPGQKLFQNAGLVPATMPVRLVHLTEDPL